MKVTLAIERSKLLKAVKIMTELKNNADALLQVWRECEDNEYGTTEVNSEIADLLLHDYKKFFTMSYDDLVNDLALWLNPVIDSINDSLNPSDHDQTPSN